MSVIEFLAELHRLGVGLRVEQGQLGVQAPRGVLTPELRSQLRHHRDELIAVLAGARDAEVTPLEPASRDQPLPASYAQQRLWFLDRLQPNGRQYNVPIAIRLGGAVDEDALRAALDGLVARHEILRTTFDAPDGVPVQVIHPPARVPWSFSDLSASEHPLGQAAALIADDAAAPFDLHRGPLLRTRLIRLGAHDRVLLLLMHHIVCDEWSADILQRDLAVLYATARTGSAPSETLPRPPVRYARLRRLAAPHAHRRRLPATWPTGGRPLAGLPDWTCPPTGPRPTTRRAPGRASGSPSMPADLVAGWHDSAAGAGTTTVHDAARRLPGAAGPVERADDFAVGTPVAGRDRAEVRTLVGFFLNTLVLRADLSGDPAFADLLDRVRDRRARRVRAPGPAVRPAGRGVGPDRERRSPLFQAFSATTTGRDTLGWATPMHAHCRSTGAPPNSTSPWAVTARTGWPARRLHHRLFDRRPLKRPRVVPDVAGSRRPRSGPTPTHAPPLLDRASRTSSGALGRCGRAVPLAPRPRADRRRQPPPRTPAPSWPATGPDLRGPGPRLANRLAHHRARWRRPGGRVGPAAAPRRRPVVAVLAACRPARRPPLDPEQPPSRLAICRRRRPCGLVDPSTARLFARHGSSLFDVPRRDPVRPRQPRRRWNPPSRLPRPHLRFDRHAERVVVSHQAVTTRATSTTMPPTTGWTPPTSLPSARLAALRRVPARPRRPAHRRRDSAAGRRSDLSTLAADLPGRPAPTALLAWCRPAAPVLDAG